jgi:dipeptidyl aminopeptidase/acylaminoacyl peptidase
MQLRPSLTATLAVIAILLAVGGCGGEDPPILEPRNRADQNPFSYDRTRSLRAEAESLGGQAGVTQESIEFASFDGEIVPAELVLPAGDATPPCVILVAGLGTPLEQAGVLAGALGAPGYAVLTVEPRYHGSRGLGTASAREAARDPRLLAKMLRGSVIDLRRAIDYLVDRRDCEGEEVGYVGLSFGGILGALLAGSDDRVGAAALVVAGGDWRTFVSKSQVQALLEDGIDEKDPERFEAALDLLEPLDPVNWIGRAASTPVLMINASDDQLVPSGSAEALHAAAREPKRVVVYEGLHNAVRGPQAAIIADEILRWLDDWRARL